MPLWVEFLVLMPLVGIILVLFIGDFLLGSVHDYFEYKHGHVGWHTLPAPAKRIWRWRHPNEPIMEYRRNGHG